MERRRDGEEEGWREGELQEVMCVCVRVHGCIVMCVCVCVGARVCCVCVYTHSYTHTHTHTQHHRRKLGEQERDRMGVRDLRRGWGPSEDNIGNDRRAASLVRIPLRCSKEEHGDAERVRHILPKSTNHPQVNAHTHFLSLAPARARSLSRSLSLSLSLSFLPLSPSLSLSPSSPLSLARCVHARARARARAHTHTHKQVNSLTNDHLATPNSIVSRLLLHPCTPWLRLHTPPQPPSLTHLAMVQGGGGSGRGGGGGQGAVAEVVVHAGGQGLDLAAGDGACQGVQQGVQQALVVGGVGVKGPDGRGGVCTEDLLPVPNHALLSKARDAAMAPHTGGGSGGRGGGGRDVVDELAVEKERMEYVKIGAWTSRPLPVSGDGCCHGASFCV